MPHPPYKAWAFSAGLWWSLGQTEPHNKSTHIMHFKSISPNIPSNVKESFLLPLLQHTPHCFCLLFFSDYFLSFLVHKTSVICRHSVFTWRDSQQVPLTKKKGGGSYKHAHTVSFHDLGVTLLYCTMFSKGRLLASTTDKAVFCLVG